jgi:AraC-like DNA-binding protein
MRSDAATAATRKWSLFDLEVPAPGRIQYPLHAGVWDPAPPGPLTMDVHQGMEIGIVLRGQMDRHFEDLVFVASAGDLHLCSAWEPHGWRVRKPDTSQVVLIFLAEVVDERAFREIPWLTFFTLPPSRRPRTSSPQMRREVLSIGKRIYREARHQPRGWMIGVRLCLFELLLTIHRYWTPSQPAGPAAPVQAGNFARVMPAVTTVYGNPARRVSSDEGAAACGLHRSRFNSVFRQTMGVSFQDFCRRARLASVAHLLLTSGLSTDAIAAETGFADGSHLHRTFVQYYGMTPGRYRAAHRHAG